MSCSKLISFAEIVHGRDSTVRVTADGMLYAVDLVMVMTGSSRDDAGETLRCLLDEIFLSVNFTDWQFPDHRGLLGIDCLSSLMSISPHVMSICTVAFMALVL